MRSTILVVAVFGVLCCQSTSFSQETSQLSVYSGFFAEQGLVEFRLQAGRLCLNPSRYRKGAAKFSPCGDCQPACCQAASPATATNAKDSTPGAASESITVMATAGIPSIHYVWRRPKHRLTVIVQDAEQLQIESERTKTGEIATLTQTPQKDLVWTVQRGQLRDEYRGATLLHLYAQDPVGLQMHCGELFQRMLRGRSLQSISEQTAAQLVRRLNQQTAHPLATSPSAARVMELVDGLRSAKSRRRRKSACELMKLGTPAVPIMRHVLASEPLELEQRDRLEKVVSRLSASINENPASLAAHLINDRGHWTHLAAGLSDEQIRRIDRRLAELNPETAGVSIAQQATTTQPAARVASANEGN